MNTTKYRILKAGALLAVIALVGGYAAAVGYAGHSHTASPSVPRQTVPAQPARAPQRATVARPVKSDVSLQTIQSKEVPAVQEAVERAIQHLEAGHQQQALDELRQIKASLESVRVALGKHVGPQIVNDRCPIMGGAINVDTVPAALTRMHGKDKVAFCCDGCPAQWGRLTYAQRTAKLQEVTIGQQQPVQDTGHQH